MTLFVGTSGFSYKEWKGAFYPEDLPANRFLEYYSQQLPAVEINNTFYRMPKAEVLENWKAQAAPGFAFVLKASRRITHQQRLVNAGDSVRYLVETSAVLGEQRGPFLLQLPPFLRADPERLESFLTEWPRGVAAAFEFRHRSWLEGEDATRIRELLADAGMALCVADTDESERVVALPKTAEYGYLRLRRSAYSDDDLEHWARLVRDAAWRDTYVFFKHEDEAAGPRMARRFRDRFDGIVQAG